MDSVLELTRYVGIDQINEECVEGRSMFGMCNGTRVHLVEVERAGSEFRICW